VRILACGLCGSDVEKLGDPAYAGAVLGHEIVAETDDGRRVALVHGRRDDGPLIRPGGFAERANAQAWVDVADVLDDARATAVEPLACVLRGVEKVPRGRILVVGYGFIGRVFAAVLRHRGDEVFAVDLDPVRSERPPPGEVDAAVVAGRGGVGTALAHLVPGGTLLVFAEADAIPAAPVYRQELTVVGSRSATPAHMEEAAGLLPTLALPEPTVLALERFHEGLELYRTHAALKVVFTP
jgi:threonine dehydrogenase-like Zn-dependent dehydrogenase